MIGRHAGLPVEIEIENGWPKPVAGIVRAEEAGIAMGALLFPGLLQLFDESRTVLSLRIDDDVQSEDWEVRRPNGTVGERIRVVPPSYAVAVPAFAPGAELDFTDWVQRTHGSLGRVLFTNPTGDWWIVNDPDLELALVCGSAEMVADLCGGDPEQEPFAWLPDPSAGDPVVVRYRLGEAGS